MSFNVRTKHGLLWEDVSSATTNKRFAKAFEVFFHSLDPKMQERALQCMFEAGRDNSRSFNAHYINNL